jgi:hypothetical protein
MIICPDKIPPSRLEINVFDGELAKNIVAGKLRSVEVIT